MSAVHHFTGKPPEDVFNWENVERKVFTTEEVKGVIKNVLVGPDDGAPNFIIRFFQVPVGGSTFDHAHPHEHGIVILHGKARVKIEAQTHELNPYDSVFLSGNDHHQIINIGETSLGFICVIPLESSEV
jgi:quercetin dioxygenase-like cupin family protein